jgi:hypothetical protein
MTENQTRILGDGSRRKSAKYDTRSADELKKRVMSVKPKKEISQIELKENNLETKVEQEEVDSKSDEYGLVYADSKGIYLCAGTGEYANFLIAEIKKGEKINALCFYKGVLLGATGGKIYSIPNDEIIKNLDGETITALESPNMKSIDKGVYYGTKSGKIIHLQGDKLIKKRKRAIKDLVRHGKSLYDLNNNAVYQTLSNTKYFTRNGIGKKLNALESDGKTLFVAGKEGKVFDVIMDQKIYQIDNEILSLCNNNGRIYFSDNDSKIYYAGAKEVRRYLSGSHSNFKINSANAMCSVPDSFIKKIVSMKKK